MMMPELNLEEERGNYWMKVYSSTRIEPGDKNQWSKQGKCYIRKQGIWLRRDWLERSKENSEEYSQCKDQSLPNLTIYPRKVSFALVLQIWARNGREVAVTEVSGMQEEVVPKEVSHWRDPTRKQPDWVLGTAAGCFLLLKAFTEDAAWTGGTWCWQSLSHQHLRRWVPWKWCAAQEPDIGEIVSTSKTWTGEAACTCQRSSLDLEEKGLHPAMEPLLIEPLLIKFSIMSAGK